MFRLRAIVRHNIENLGKHFMCAMIANLGWLFSVPNQHRPVTAFTLVCWRAAMWNWDTFVWRQYADLAYFTSFHKVGVRFCHDAEFLSLAALP